MTLIGRRCKHSNVLSWPILIRRGLDLNGSGKKRNAGACEWRLARFTVRFWRCRQSAHPLEKKRAYKRTRTKFSLHTFFFKRKYAPLAQLVEQLTLNQWVPGSNPWRRTTRPVGQAVKTAASHAANMGSIPVRVTTYFFLKEKVGKKNFILSFL